MLSLNEPQVLPEDARPWNLQDVPGVAWKSVGRRLDAGVALITPELASHWLTFHNQGNRNISARSVEKFSREMRENRWKLNGEPIIFDRNARLRNGQHRLQAVITSGVSIWCLIIGGVEDDVMPTIDQHRPRTGADVLVMAGRVNAAALSAMATVVVRWEKGLGFTSSVTPGEQIECLDRHPELANRVSVVHKSKKQFRSFPHTNLAALHYLFTRYSAEAADDFVDRLIEGMGLEAGDPILTLRNRVLANQAATAKLSTQHLHAFIIKTWNATQLGQSLKILKWLDVEDMPAIYGVDRAGGQP